MFAFKFEKSLQAAAYLLRRESSRQMNYMRLVKVLYMADRESLKARGEPITGDRFAALERGPVLSEVLDLIKGSHLRSPEWGEFIRRDEFDVVLARDPGVTHLSRFEVELLERVAEENRAYDEWDMVKITHQFPEWRKNDPGKARKWIPLKDILEAVGRPADLPDIETDAEAARAFARVFGA
jgi:uncharacterized phage-associated protein